MIWLILMVVFLVIEALTFNLVTIWFAIGSLAALISSYFTDNICIQIAVFIFISIISLLITKPLLKKYFKPGKEKTNYDRIIGEIGIVTKDISKHENGRVKIDGKDWMASSNKNIEKGKEVEILKIEGVKLIVKEKE